MVGSRLKQCLETHSLYSASCICFPPCQLYCRMPYAISWKMQADSVLLVGITGRKMIFLLRFPLISFLSQFLRPVRRNTLIWQTREVQEGWHRSVRLWNSKKPGLEIKREPLGWRLSRADSVLPLTSFEQVINLSEPRVLHLWVT